METDRYIAAVDLGSSKIAIAVAHIKGEHVDIVYYKEHPSDGIRNSNVAIPQRAAGPLAAAIREAEEALMIRIRQVVTGHPRYSVTQQNATEQLERQDPEDYISAEEVAILKEAAIDTYPLDDPKSQMIYGAIPQSFATDDEMQLVEEDVVGRLSSTLEGMFKIFIGSRRSNTAVDKIFSNMGIGVARKYFLPDVTARTVLSPDDMKNGAALIDFGAGVTSVAIYHGGVLRYYGSIPFGGRSITNDIRIECSISEELAENIKLAYGACLPGKLASMSEKVLQIRYDYAPFKEVSIKHLSDIIDSRAREIVDAILYKIQESGFADYLRAGVIVTGGGAGLANFTNLVKEMSGYNVRTGYPRHLFSVMGGCTGVYETEATGALGLIFAAKADGLPDCTEEHAPAAAAAVRTVHEEVPAGETGTLIAPEEFGPEERRPPKKKRDKVEMKTRDGNIVKTTWTRLFDWIEQNTDEDV